MAKTLEHPHGDRVTRYTDGQCVAGVRRCVAFVGDHVEVLTRPVRGHTLDRGGQPATQNNLGNALWRLGERESGTARLEEAVAAYRAALTERTRERVPLDWAATQNNLGNALQTLGELESGTARLEEAIAAFRAALTERTRERVPFQWAMSTGNLAVAQRALAERTGDAQMEQTALSQIELAIATMRAGGHESHAAYFEGQMRKRHISPS